MLPRRENLLAALGFAATMLACARAPRPQPPATDVASAPSACESEPLRSEVARLKEMQQRAHALLVDTAVYTRMQVHLERAKADTALQGQLSRLMADTALHARTDRLMADPALNQRLEDARARFAPHADSMFMKLDSLLACLAKEPVSPR